VAARGADHNRSGAYEVDFSPAVDRRNVAPEDAWRAAETEDAAALLDSLILCKFVRRALDDPYADAARMLRLVAGWDTTADELRHTARRIIHAKKLFNMRAGWTPEEDTLPERLLSRAPDDDPAARLTRDQLSELVRAYNRYRGWTNDGYLTAATASRFDLEDFLEPAPADPGN